MSRGAVATANGTAPRPSLQARASAAPGSAAAWSIAYLSLIVLIPLAAVVAKSFEDGLGSFWDDVTAPQAVAALKLTLIASLIVVAINAVVGTIIAWVLVRDEFPGKRLINSLIDLPFALPTIVAGLTLLALYGADSPLGHRASPSPGVGVVMALLFVTLPFVVRAGAAGADRARPRDGGGRGLARRRAASRSSAGSSSRTCARRSSPASRSPSPARSASSARWS